MVTARLVRILSAARTIERRAGSCIEDIPNGIAPRDLANRLHAIGQIGVELEADRQALIAITLSAPPTMASAEPIATLFDVVDRGDFGAVPK